MNLSDIIMEVFAMESSLLRSRKLAATGTGANAADACAVYLGMLTPKGKPNRRGFLERVACRPEFPKPNQITRSWKKSEVDEWAMETRTTK